VKICRDVVEGVLAEVDVEGLVVDLPVALAENVYVQTVDTGDLINLVFRVIRENVPNVGHR